MKIIGLTGGIATGKTTASHYLERLGVPIIDADIINKELLEPKNTAYLAVLEIFPDIPLLENSALDKHYMRHNLLSDNDKKKQLEALLHPLIKNEICKQIKALKQQKLPYCVVSVAILIEAQFDHLVDYIWVTDCPEELQIERLMHRDNMSLESAQTMLSLQLSRQQRLSFADSIIPTKNKKDMINCLDSLHNSI